MGSHSYLVNLYDRTSPAHADQPSYMLMEMPTNIGILATQGLLNSNASKDTITNVGELDGSRSSVINLGLQQLTGLPCYTWCSKSGMCSMACHDTPQPLNY